jgi:SulP family sulfate permease
VEDLVLPDDVLVYQINGPVFFAAVDTFEHALGSTHTDPRALVLRLGRVPFVDITGIQALEEIIDNLTGRHVRVVVCEANTRVRIKLERAGLIGDGARAAYAETLADAIQTVAPDREPAVA